jgi:DNA-binding transcriptional regulator YiaG
MPKYSTEEREALAAVGKRLGIGKVRDKKIADIRDRPAKGAPKKERAEAKKRGGSRRETEIERRERMIAMYKLKPLPLADIADDYDVTNPTRYQAVVMWNAGDLMLDKILNRYKHVMNEQVITPRDFQRWREFYMLMNPEQLGALVRVSARTIRNWENGETPIPFSMWWVMHVTMQDPEYFLTRPGFHDYYIEYVDGVPLLCSHSYPDIRWTTTDLYVNRCAVGEATRLRRVIDSQDENLRELAAENTRLRQMLKTKGVTAELQAMHEHIGQMMQRIQTADVMPFQTEQESPPVANHSHKAA